MAQCPLTEKCGFLNDDLFLGMPGLVRRFQQIYCQNKFDECARHRVNAALGEDSVPSLMMPSQNEWADQILAEQVPVKAKAK